MSTSTQRPRFIAFASPKGGVGKSTTCACLAGALVARGHQVLILDLDLNRTLEHWALRFPNAVPGLTVRGVEEADLMTTVKDLYENRDYAYVLIDVAGAFHQSTLGAATLADLTISPAKLSAPDIIEARKLNKSIQGIGQKIGKFINHRLLLNEVSQLWPTYQRAALADAQRCGVPPFETLLNQRAPYAEMFLTGLPPHFADKSRETTMKAVAQMDALTDEILEALDGSDIVHINKEAA